MKTYCLLQRTEDNDHLWRAVQEGPWGTFSVDLLQHVCLPQLPAPTHFDCLKDGPEKWPRLVVKREEKKLGTQATKRFGRICSYFLHVCNRHLNLQFIAQLFCLIYYFIYPDLRVRWARVFSISSLLFYGHTKAKHMDINEYIITQKEKNRSYEAENIVYGTHCYRKRL